MGRALFLVIAGLLLSCGAASAAGATPVAHAGTSSGVIGVLFRGPVTPVCRVGIPCDAPSVGSTLVFSRLGHDVARVRTRTGGRFSLALKPGVYAVRIVPAASIGSGPTPRVVRIPVGSWARVRLMVDTGIR